MERRGLCSKIESFAVEHPADILLDCTSGAVYAWQLRDKKLFSRRFASDFEKFFIALATLTYKILPESEQNLKFFKQITEHFWQEIVKFYKFKPHLNFSYQILLPHKTKAVKSFAKKHFKAIKTTRIFTRKTKFHLLNLTSY